ncbi:hypothetical protein [Nocardioides bizhenqiangii]|uniref:Uncharacterized protein n=1 Tax=Nocardioides bizhenqiangii TaxID=3095076 RepID=A0ABZ0ZVM3_9ACTN|nr:MULTISPECIES: hypothetical protein [unclassified Nocardioides]MDZ5623182.1 hypothetical protein [Nocardioides sp. HM23]WQQ28155.1 hypothetical protein SHK19_07960 [Nocardioides sp. HM61]
MADKSDKPTHDDSVNHTALTIARVRGIVARTVWVICLSLALILAAAAFSFALDANDENELVQLIRDLANAFDLTFFDLDKPVKEFAEPNSDVKNALFNYGICAVVYLILGRFLERLIRP